MLANNICTNWPQHSIRAFTSLPAEAQEFYGDGTFANTGRVLPNVKRNARRSSIGIAKLLIFE